MSNPKVQELTKNTKSISKLEIQFETNLNLDGRLD